MEENLLVVEVGTGGGSGSTAAIHRALVKSERRFCLLGYEGDPELARLASGQWRDADDVQVVNEYFMAPEDVERTIRPHVRMEDRAAYLPEFEKLASQANHLSTTPPGPIGLLFIDSVRYTHLAIVRAAMPWLRPKTVVLMEDDIPGYGELAILESELTLCDIAKHEIGGHSWPLVQFRVVQG